MIKANIDDNKAMIELKGSPKDIAADYAYIGARIMTAYKENGLSKVDAAFLMSMSFNAAIKGEEALKKLDKEETDKECELTPGDHFKYNGLEFVLLEITEAGDYLAITASMIASSMQFSTNNDDGSNNWAVSDLREWLNGGFIDEHFNKKHLVKSISDLTADNGDKRYGTCEDYLTLLSCDQYRKYRDIVPHYDGYVWTLTPWRCDAGVAYLVCFVYPSGALYDSYFATNSNGVAPACIFNHNIVNPRRQARTGDVVLVERESEAEE